MIRNLVQRLASLIAALVLPLAAGALWSAMSLRFQAELPAMALLCAAATLPSRAHLAATAWLRGVLSMSCCAVGIVYAQWLKSASVVASEIGIGFIDALQSIGTEFTYALAISRTGSIGLALIAAALGLSFIMGMMTTSADPRDITQP